MGLRYELFTAVQLAPALSERLEGEHTSTEEILVGLEDGIAILPQLSKEEPSCLE